MGQKLKGLVAQKLDGRKALGGVRVQVVSMTDATTGSGSMVIPRSCVALIYAIGPGGSGEVNVNPSGGGGGGAALFKQLSLSRGQTISWIVGTAGAGATVRAGNDATDTAVSYLDRLLVAGGGKGGGVIATNVAGAGGLAIGGDINRSGGAGGASFSAGVAAGFGGGAGGAGTGGIGAGGGGGAGFAEVSTLVAGGAGSGGNSGAAGGALGGGSGSSNSAPSGAGGAGRVIIWLIRLY